MTNDEVNLNERVCPDCGEPNSPGAVRCGRCNSPLDLDAAAEVLPEAAGQDPVREDTRPPAEAAAPRIAPSPRLERQRAKRKVKDPSLTLWLVIGVLGAGSLLVFALQGFQKSNSPQVEGAKPDQQQRADEIRAAIEKDSTFVPARVALGDVLYDTGNWVDAIVEYRAALRMDSTRVEALVDLGVCYFNLGFTDEAGNHFGLALSKNPQQTVALFNMGILSERREDPATALDFYHRALQTNPPDHLKEPIVTALTRTQGAAGRTAPPLPEGP